MSEQPNLCGVLEKYQQLLIIIEEMKRDIKAPYVGNKAGIERLRKNIHIARIYVQQCSEELNRLPTE